MGLAGRVIVVAGEGGRIEQIVPILLAGDALVALVAGSTTVPDTHAWFRVDASDPEAWSRIVPHVEQRLGPIDAAVTTSVVHSYVRELLEPDMRRRGHGGVIDVETADDVNDAIRRLETLL